MPAVDEDVESYQEMGDTTSQEIISDPSEYDDYVDSVLADVAGFVQLSEAIFVVQGWEARKPNVSDNCSEHVVENST